MRTLLLFSFLCLAETASFSQGTHGTSFRPSVDGFHFYNSFSNTFFDQLGVKITTGGLCGGMSYTALDYFNRRMGIPRQTYMPADHTMLYDYIYSRQVTSLAENVDKWTELVVNPFGWRTDEFFNWGLQGSNGGRLQELKSFIDRGMPVPLGLFEVGDGGFRPHHQVLAIGYDCGRYQGNLGNFQTDFKLYCYNPNYPGDTSTLMCNPAQHYYYWKGHENDDNHYITYFVDKKYGTKTPPPDPSSPAALTDCKAHELVIQFNTGDDDLRGGGDNCNLTLNFNNGTSQQFPNVNNGAHWIDNTGNTIELWLTDPQPLSAFKNLVIYTKQCGGISCDNWNLNQVNVLARGGFPDQTILNQQGNPLKRFTGSDYSGTYYFTNLPPCNGSGSGGGTTDNGLTRQLLVNFRTGGDDLRGGNDNLAVTVVFRDGSRQAFTNVNNGLNWSNNSSNNVSLNLNKAVNPNDITSLEMQTNACGGMSCDNWNFQGITVKAEGNNMDKVIYNQSGNPIFRFTGSNHVYNVIIRQN